MAAFREEWMTSRNISINGETLEQVTADVTEQGYMITNGGKCEIEVNRTEIAKWAMNRMKKGI